MNISERDIRIVIDALLDAREAFVWAVERLDVLREELDRSARRGDNPPERVLKGVVQVLLRVAPHADPQAERLAAAWLDWCQNRHDQIARNGVGPERSRQELRAAQVFDGPLYLARFTAEEMVKRFAIGRNELSGAMELLRAWGPPNQRHGLSERFQKACLCLEAATEDIVMNGFCSGHLLDRAMGQVGQAREPAVEPALLDATTNRPRSAASTPKPKCGGVLEAMLIGGAFQNLTVAAPKPECGGLFEAMLTGSVFQNLTVATPGANIAADRMRHDERPHTESHDAESIEDANHNGGDAAKPAASNPKPDDGSADDTSKVATDPPPGGKSEAKRSRRGRKPAISEDVRKRWLEIRKDYDAARLALNFNRDDFCESHDLAPKDLTRILNNTTPAKLKR